MAYDAPTLTLRDARTRYFEDNHFGADGGYNAAWVDFKLGPIPMPFPNTPARVRAVRVHDLQHVLTGYPTDIQGECEISAWELASGCKDYYAAWALNTGGTGLGLLVAPRRTFRAWVRGRHSANLYGYAYDDALLSRTVVATREELGVERARTARATAGDVLSFVLVATSGLLAGLAALPFFAAMAPIGVLSGMLARRRAAAAQPAR